MVKTAADPHAPELVADQFRAHVEPPPCGPPRFVPELNVWALSGYADVAEAARDATCFSCRDTNGLSRRSLNVLVGTDPPEHTRLRRLSAPAFATSRLASLAPRMNVILSQRVATFVQRGGGDAVRGLAEPLACDVFSEILGLEPAGLAARRRGRVSPRRAGRGVRSFSRPSLNDETSRATI